MQLLRLVAAADVVSAAALQLRVDAVPAYSADVAAVAVAADRIVSAAAVQIAVAAVAAADPVGPAAAAKVLSPDLQRTLPFAHASLRRCDWPHLGSFDSRIVGARFQRQIPASAHLHGAERQREHRELEIKL